MSDIQLRGITWDHPRGRGGLEAAATVYEANTGVRVEWDARSLLAFGDQPLANIVQGCDLLVVDHPHMELPSVSWRRLMGSVEPARLRSLQGTSVGRSHESYSYDGRQWAVAIDAAAQVMARRPDRLSDPPQDWAEVADLARRGEVVWPLKSVDAYSSFCSLSASAQGFDHVPEGLFVDPTVGEEAFNLLLDVSQHLDPECFSMDPPAALELLATTDCYSLAPLLFGYSNYSRASFRQHQLAFSEFIGMRGGHAGSLLGGAGLAVTSATAQPDEAGAFALWVASDEIQRTIYLEGGGQPAALSAWSDAEADRSVGGFFTSTRATLDGAWRRPRDPWYPSFQVAAKQLSNSALRARADPAGTVEALNRLYRDHTQG